MALPTSPLSLGRRLWLVALTGLPFALFKVGGGMAAAEDVHPYVGFAFVAWGVLDGLLNVAVLAAPVHVSFCFLSNLGRFLDGRWPRPGHEQLFLAIDTFATFAIVASMIWFNRTARLAEPMPTLWTLAVIGNILGVGMERVWQSVLQRQSAA
jgi:hypothetical protein